MGLETVYFHQMMKRLHELLSNSLPHLSHHLAIRQARFRQFKNYLMVFFIFIQILIVHSVYKANSEDPDQTAQKRRLFRVSAAYLSHKKDAGLYWLTKRFRVPPPPLF